MSKLLTSLVIGAALSATACGGNDGSDLADDAPRNVELRSTVAPAHEFVVGETEYSLVETEQREFLLLGTAPPSVQKYPHTVLVDEYGRLTMLEMLFAFAPDQSPSAHLAEYHKRQVKAFGRADESIRRVEYSAPPVDKAFTGSDCGDFATATVDALPNRETVDSSWNKVENATKAWEYTNFTFRADALTVCNPTLPSIPYYLGWQYEGSNWQFFGWQTLPQNWNAFVVGDLVYPYVNRRRHMAGAYELDGGIIYFGEATGL